MQPGGRVILLSTSLCNFSSLTPNYLLYVTSKGAIEQMVRILAKDLGTKGITVNCVAPGPTATELFFQGKSEEVVKRIASANPFGRIGEPGEITRQVQGRFEDALHGRAEEYREWLDFVDQPSQDRASKVTS